MIEISHPVMVPGTCMVCTSGDTEDRRWFDFQIDAWKRGRLYICSLCVINLANILKINPNQELLERVAELEKTNERGNDAIAILAGLRVLFESMDLDTLDSEPLLKPRTQGAKEPASK